MTNGGEVKTQTVRVGALRVINLAALIRAQIRYINAHLRMFSYGLRPREAILPICPDR